ncbi:hypothetical protein NHQ30_011283 [Ciborinia camelliae]|nr:hypothetical protein NHQ30_011283 [Ciborinia camelliae]
MRQFQDQPLGLSLPAQSLRSSPTPRYHVVELAQLKNHGIMVGAASRTSAPELGREMLRLVHVVDVDGMKFLVIVVYAATSALPIQAMAVKFFLLPNAYKYRETGGATVLQAAPYCSNNFTENTQFWREASTGHSLSIH